MALLKFFTMKSKMPMLYGIDIRDTAIYLLALQRVAGRYTISKASRLPLPHGVVVNLTIQTPAALVNALRQLREHNGGTTIETVAVSVPATAAITKIISLQERLTDLEIEHHLACQLPHYLNMTPETVYFDYERFTNNEISSPAIRLVAVRREEVDGRVNLLQAAGWQVMAVDTEPLALERAARWLATPQEKQQMIGVILLTLTTAALYVMHQGYLIFSRIEHYHPTATQQDEHSLPAALQHLWQWFALTKPAAQLDQLFLSGETSVVTELLTIVPSVIPINQVSQSFSGLEAANPFANCEVAPDIDTTLLTTYASEYLVSYGLAIRSWER
ncbi:MAG: pilus assembly protein PilM [Gammaproteobacteria bacterium]